MIVKVQIPQATNDHDAGALIYNKDHTVCATVPITDEMLVAMEGEPKKFFHAHIEEENIALDKEAKWQDW